MNIKEWDFPELSFGNLSALIYYDGDLIDSFTVSSYKTEDTYRDSMVSSLEYFNFEGVGFTLEIISSKVGVYIALSTDNDDSMIDYSLFDVALDEGEDISDIFATIDTYMPTLSYTDKASSVLYGLEAYLAENKKLLPFFYVENTDRFSVYQNDDLISYEHFLDLWEIQDIANRHEREVVSEAKLTDKTQKMPPKEYGPATNSAILELYNNVANKSRAIPVIHIGYDGVVDNISKLCGYGYEKIALRITSPRLFLDKANELSKNSNIEYLIFDLNTNFDPFGISRIFKDSEAFFRDKTLVYLGANFNTGDLSIPQKECNKNHFAINRTLAVYFELKKDFVQLVYGDYAGFDRKPNTKIIGKPTARVVLSSLEGEKDEILIRRGFDPRDINQFSQGYKHSMIRLLGDIHNGALQDGGLGKKFLNSEEFDADFALKSFGPVSTTPGNIKIICLRHNIFSTINKYMKFS